MDNNEILFVNGIVKELINFSKTEYKLLEMLINLEINEKIDTPEYDEIIKRYRFLEEVIDGEINKLNTNRRITLADNIVMGLMHKINNDPIKEGNIEDIAVLRINKRLDTLQTITTSKNKAVDEIVETIRLSQTYDMINSVLYYLHDFTNLNNSKELKNKLIEYKYTLAYITFIVEGTMLDIKYRKPEKLVLTGEYYMNKCAKYFRSISFEEDAYLSMLIDKIKRIINYTEKDLEDIETLEELAISLAHIKAASLRLDEELINKINKSVAAKTEKVASLLQSTLYSAIKEKHNVYYLKKVL